MKKYLVFITAFVLIFSACGTEELPEIGWTRIDADFFEGSDEMAKLNLDEVPFSVEIPDGWSWTETPPEYILWIDQGSVGSITIDKNPVREELSVLVSDEWIVFQGKEGVKTYCSEEQCFVSLNEGQIYSAIVTDRNFSEKELTQVGSILRSFEVD